MASYTYPQQPGAGGGYQPQGYNPYEQQQQAGMYGQPSQNQGPFVSNYGGMADAEAGVPKHEFGFTDRLVRVKFVRKVFTMVGLMLGVVTLMTIFPHLHNPTLLFLKGPHAAFLFMTSYITFLVVYIALMCCEGVRRSHPTNLILTGVLTVSMGYLTMMLAAQKQPEIVMLTLVVTTISCGGIILFSMQTRVDFTNCMGVLIVASLFVMIFGLVAMVAAIAFKVKALMLVYSFCAALLFMVYLAVDVQMLMGGRKLELSPEEHVFASIQIFMDIVYIFWMLLAIFGGNNN